MDLRRYAELFLTESREHLSAINHHLLELERTPDASEPVSAIFRAVHTVKGMSATMGYRAVTELAHELESLLDRVRRGEQRVTQPVMDVFFQAADALESAIELSVEGREGEVDVAGLVERLKALVLDGGGGVGVAAGAGAAGERRGGTDSGDGARRGKARGAHRSGGAAAPPAGGTLVRVRLAAGTPLRGARAYLVVKRAESLGTVVAVMPSLEALQAEEFDRDFALRLETRASPEEITRALLGVGEVEAVMVG